MKDNIGPIDARSLTHGDGHYFFGYYDLPAWSANGKYHLCHRVKFMDRIPNKNDEAEIIAVDMDSREPILLAKTTAWNFQQGSMLQWNPTVPDDEIIFNNLLDGAFRGVVMNIESGKQRVLDAPVANVDPSGRYALSINFSRQFDFRPGYGYDGIPDKFYDMNHSEEDGVSLIDIKTGKNRLIISYQQIWDLTGHFFQGRDEKIMINHITFNTDGSRFVFLVRNFPNPQNKWKTAIMTSNWDGTDVYCLSKGYTYASHYNWRDTNHLLIYAYGRLANQLYLLTDKTEEVQTVDTGYFLKDGHCSYSPDRNYLLYDSYPDENSNRNLYLYDLRKNSGITLGAYYSDPLITKDIRSDLHPRWNRTGTMVSFDSIHEGKRNVYYVDLKEVL